MKTEDSTQADTLPPDKQGWKSVAALAFAFLLGTAFAITFSIALGETLLGITFVLWMWRSATHRHWPCCPPWCWAALGFIILCFITALWGPEARGWGKSPRLLWFLVLPATLSLVTDVRRVKLVMGALSIGGTLLALQILIKNPWIAAHRQGMFLDQLIDVGSMTDGQMLMVGMVLSLGLFFMTRADCSRRSWLWLVSFFVQLLAMIINFKRGSWISVVIILGALLLLMARRRVVFGALILFLILLILPPVRVRLAQLATEFNRHRGGRMTMWCEIAPKLIHDHPWGIGYGTMTNHLLKQISSEVEPNRNHLHSNPLQILVETGWLGLAAYVIWMGWLLFRAITLARQKRNSKEGMALLSVFLALCGLMINGLVEYNFGDTELIVVYGLLMGLIAFYDTPRHPVEAKPLAS